MPDRKHPDTIVIRPAVAADASDICEVCKNGLGYECDAELVKYRLEQLKQDEEIVFVSDIGEKTVGFVHAQTYRCLYYETALNILGLAVLPDFRRNGIGSALMKAVEDRAKKLGINVIRLNSGASRKGAHEFYRKIGYHNEKEQIRFLKYLQE
ncbi:MAG: GNAT family N-acetyltransferase [Clostridia bacterium]|nr:GNAT family N-acetyltransferase [Clostridia bacterium]